MATNMEIDGSDWAGVAELWLDPLGDSCQKSDCTISITGLSLRYTWSHDGEEHSGRIDRHVDVEHADFSDTWHQPAIMQCRVLANSRCIFQVEGTYGPDEDWGWRIALCLRSATDELVLQMTNIAPWGEEVRAVRMICKRAKG